MRPLRLEPRAPVLLESMRAIGYEPQSALADLVDNSITACSSRVDFLFPPGRPGHLAILDNGLGMTESALVEAMRHGSRSPNEVRHEQDLGRFGLGMKTASMSQCRRLTVVSHRDGRTSAVCWDLDDVGASGDWICGVLDPDDIARVPYADRLQRQASGTLVVWEKLDRLGAGDSGDGTVFGERVDAAMSHLALVFHRFLAGAGASRVAIAVNNRLVAPVDPFLDGLGTQEGPEETIMLEGHPVTVRAFTLPHISRLSREQIDRAGGEAGLRRQQGFYVYRHKRLIVWGTWFRLARQEELSKLTRVRVDVPNALDHLWSLDIKKSSASPPAVLRDRLRGLIPRMVQSAAAVQQYRGRVTTSGSVLPLWHRFEERGRVRYEINTAHPMVEALTRNLQDSGNARELAILLRALTLGLPIEAIYNDRSNDRMGFLQTDDEPGALLAELEEMARQMLAAFGHVERQRLVARLDEVMPFMLHRDLLPELKARLS